MATSLVTDYKYNTNKPATGYENAVIKSSMTSTPLPTVTSSMTHTPLPTAQQSTQQPALAALELFQPDLFPHSSSVQGSSGSSQQVGSSTQQSQGSSQADSGIDWQNPFMQQLLPQLQDSINNIPGNIDQWTRGAADYAEANTRSLLNNNMAPVLEGLAARGLLNSSVGEAAIARSLNNIAEQSLAAQYAAQMKGAEMKQEVPTILSKLAELARRSSSSSQNVSSGQSSNVGTSNQNSYGYSMSADPSVPYSTLLNALTNMM